MSLTLNSNISSLRAQRRLAESSNGLSRTFERLASGQRINRASDDAAGLAIASSLSVNSRIFAQAIRNANDGISALNIADGALGELGTILTRLTELAEQGANGTLSIRQRLSLDAEAQQLTNEFNRQISVTNFNGLGLLDLSNAGIGIQLGTGNSNIISAALGQQLDRAVSSGSFSTGTEPPIGGTLDGWASADFNNDGITDVVAGEALGSGTLVYLGSQSGTFSSGTVIGDDSTTSSIAAGDVNGDGNADVLYYDADTSGYSVRYGNGSGGFAAAQSVLTSGVLSDVKLVDFTGDGKVEIVGYSGTTVSVYQANAAGSFSLKSAQTLSGLLDYDVGDINGDGKVDLILGSSTALSTRLGIGDATFGGSVDTTTTGLRSIALGDLNHDGVLDLVTGKNGSLTTQVGNGDGTFKTAVSYTATGTGNNVRLADVSGDGELDIVSQASGTLRLFQNNGDGTFGTGITIASGSSANFSVADFNGDGVLDVLTGLIDLSLYNSNTQQSTSIQRFNLTTQSESRNALTLISAYLLRVQAEQSSVGVTQSRLGAALSNLGESLNAYKAAESRIIDVDVASEAAQMTRLKILQEVSSAVLAQANGQPRLALSLLRDN